jgi:hypothetical protein
MCLLRAWVHGMEAHMHSRVKMPINEMCDEYWKKMETGGKPTEQDRRQFRNNIFESILLASRTNQTTDIQWAIARYKYNCGPNCPVVDPSDTRGNELILCQHD